MEEDGKNTSEAWGLPISNVDAFSNLSDSQFLVRVLGPKHMGYEVKTFFEFFSSCHACRQNFLEKWAWHLAYVGHVCMPVNEVADDDMSRFWEN